MYARVEPPWAAYRSVCDNAGRNGRFSQSSRAAPPGLRHAVRLWILRRDDVRKLDSGGKRRGPDSAGSMAGIHLPVMP